MVSPTYIDRIAHGLQRSGGDRLGTLLDIIRDDQPPASVPATGAGAGDPLVRRAVSLPPPTMAAPFLLAPMPVVAFEAAPVPPPPPPAAAANEEQEQKMYSHF